MASRDTINVTLQILANLGVLGGIIFLGIELKQNTEMMESQTRNEISQSILRLLEMERHSDLVTAYMKIEDGTPLDPKDRYFLDNMANATLRHWENTYYQYKKGLFDQEEFEADFEVWRDVMLNEVNFSQHWQKMRHTYSQEFRSIIDDLINERRPET